MALIRHHTQTGLTVNALVLAASAGFAVVGFTGTSRAQTPASTQGETAGAEGFAGLRLPLESVRGEISFSASRAWVWGDSDGTQRLFLSGDVRVQMGVYDLHAARAAVWIERIEDSASASDAPADLSAISTRAGVYQVYVYFDRVGNPRGPASVSIAADRLPVRAVLDCAAEPAIRADLLTRGEPGDPFRLEAERAFSRSIRQIVAADEDASTDVPFERPPTPKSPPTVVDPSLSRPYRAGSDLDLSDPTSVAARRASKLPFGDENAPIFARRGIITLSAGNLVYVNDAGKAGTLSHTPGNVGAGSVAGAAEEMGVQPEPGEALLIASDGLVVQYTDPGSVGKSLQIEAQRAIVFLEGQIKENEEADPNPVGVIDPSRIEAGRVRGVYVEGDVVATDGKYTIRGPKIYYDVRNNRAVIIDAVFFTYDQDRGLPLYVRAQSLRQESRRQFKAERARFSASAFFEPEFSIGAQSITVTQEDVEIPPSETASSPLPTRAGLRLPGAASDDISFATRPAMTRTRTKVEASGITLNAGELPFFYVPTFEGDPEDVPLRDVRIENSSGSGPAIKTRWDLLSLMPSWLERQEGENRRFDLLAQYYFERGAALGADSQWSSEDSRGKFFAYSIIEDNGSDFLKAGSRRERRNDTRGMFLGEQTWTLDDQWSLFAEGAYLGDETFVDAFAENLAESRREFATQTVLTRSEGNTAFSTRFKASLNDFVANEWLLQSKGYSVAKLPEIAYTRQADRLFGESWLGDATWTHEYRYSMLSMQFDEVFARERGFDRPDLSTRAFGILPGERLSDVLRTQGLMEDGVSRLDTRQEIAFPREYGPVRIEPFVVARGTWYDDDFRTYSPGQSDNSRLWGATGVRLGTELHRVDERVSSGLFDINQMRHIIEPSATLQYAGSTVNRTALPAYDEDIENLSQGTTTRLGIDQTWQTKRGDTRGPLSSHSVDLFKLSTHVSFASGIPDPKGLLNRWYEFRPELSNPGDFADISGLWQVSSAMAITGSSIFDFNSNQQDRSTVGLIIQHDPRFSTFLESRYINPLDSTFVDVGASYELTRRYSVSGLASYDVSAGGFQGAGGELRRGFDGFTVGLRLSYNNITDETSFGFVVKPTPIGKRTRARVLDNEPELSGENNSIGSLFGPAYGPGY